MFAVFTVYTRVATWYSKVKTKLVKFKVVKFILYIVS